MLGQATAGAHCREELRPPNRFFSRRKHAQKNPDLSTGQLSEEFQQNLVIVGAELVAWDAL